MRSIDLPRYARAQTLRRDSTEAEKRLWRRLKNRALDGHKFVRQLPIGPYFVDLACKEQKFIIEIDGATHSTQAEIARDAVRAKFLQAEGYRVLRVSNADVYESVDGVLEWVLAAIEGRVST
jgi:very-short-patch-repair endonuclease